MPSPERSFSVHSSGQAEEHKAPELSTEEKKAAEQRSLSATAMRRQVEENGSFSESFTIRPNGTLERQGKVPALQATLYGEHQTPDDLYDFMRKTMEEHPWMHVQFDRSRDGSKITYTVRERTPKQSV